MAVSKYLGEKLGSRSSGASRDGTRWYQRTYEVETESASIGEDQVRWTRLLPQLGWRHPFYQRAICVNVDPEQVPETSTLWEVRVRWEYDPSQRDDEDKPPWERNARLRFDEVLIEPTELKDLDEQPFLNAALDPFDPAPTVPRSDCLLTIERAELEYDEDKAMGWGNKVNVDRWRGYPPHAALMHMPTASDAWEKDTHYWNVVYRIWIKGGCFEDPPDLWIPLKVLNQGARCRVQETLSNGTKVWKTVWCKDEKDVDATKVQLLNADGTQMTHAQVEADGPNWIEFRNYDTEVFADLFPGA